MQMRYGFACIRTAVEHETIAALLQAEYAGNFSRLEQQMTQYPLIIGSRFCEARDRFFGNNEDVRGRLWFDVAKGQHEFVFVYDRCRNFPRRDLLKKGLAHTLQA